MKLTEFDIYRQILLDKSGLDITQDKTYLLESRLKPVAKKWGYPALDMMTMALNGVPDPELISDIVEAMTTSETSFFRDGKPFQNFEQFILPYMAKTRTKAKNLRIWCAACSSGQEPYSLAITVKEAQENNILPNWKVQILATDISDDILQQAQEARYSQFEVQRGLPVQLLMKYFEQDGDQWQLNDDVKSMVTFHKHNLIETTARLDTFDIIFCRNVLVYFNQKTKKNVIENMLKHLVPDGFMVLGDTESPSGITENIKSVPDHANIYVHADGPHDTATQATGT